MLAGSACLVAIGDEVVVATIVTPRPGKGVGKDAAFQILAKRLADIGLGDVLVALAVELAGTGQQLVVKDAHTTKSKDLENRTKLDAAMLVQDLNIAKTWLSYPGRKNATAKAHEIVFACESVETVTS